MFEGTFVSSGGDTMISTYYVEDDNTDIQYHMYWKVGVSSYTAEISGNYLEQMERAFNFY